MCRRHRSVSPLPTRVRVATALRQVSHSRANLTERTGAARDRPPVFSTTLRHARARRQTCCLAQRTRSMPDPDANIICRNIAMHALTDITRVTRPDVAASRAAASIASPPCRASASLRVRRSGTPRLSAFTI